MGVGIALGAAIGIALGNLALGMGIGIALGGAMIAYQRNKDKQSDHSDDESR
jgi:F0F1-type ATP synthase membrane subunit c/vacuolar-type H+-ATPase subunit K